VTSSLLDLRAMMVSWDLALTAENKSPTTIASYLRCARLYLEWCEGNGHPVEITRAQVQTYTAELIRAGKEANTVRLRQASLRAFARWLVAEDELSADPLIGLKPPKIPANLHPRTAPRTCRPARLRTRG
jgi:integrase/recombinase XerD